MVRWPQGMVGSSLPREEVSWARVARCFSGAISLGLVAVIAGCSGFALPSAVQRHTVDGGRAPDFAGTAMPVSLADCPAVLPEAVATILVPRSPRTAADYSRIGCWTGRLAGKPFGIGEYFSPHAGGGVVVEYGGAIVGRIATGSGVPTIVRFTADYVCTAERAGAYFVAVNLRTGARMADGEAQRTCPPATWPPRYVLGLGARQYPVRWPRATR